MLDLLALWNTQCVKHTHQTFRTEQSHQIIFQGQIESGLTRISLTTRTASQLVINTSGLMTLRTDDL